KQFNLAKTSRLWFAVIICGTLMAGCSMRRNSTETRSSFASLPPSAPAVKIKTKKEIEADFKAKTNEFTALPVKTQLTQRPYLKGKVAFYLKNLRDEESEAVWVFDDPAGGKPDLSSVAAGDP